MAHDPVAPRGKGLRSLPALAVVAAMGLCLLASRLWSGIESGKEPGARANAKASTQTAEAVSAAKAFLKTLSAEQRAAAVLAFDNTKKHAWSNLPVSQVPRNGLRLGDLTPVQQKAAKALLAAVLSKEGYRKVIDIMDDDDFFMEAFGKPKPENNIDEKGRKRHGHEVFYLSLFGTPSATKPWMVQYTGHHLRLNVTVDGKNLVMEPTLTGTFPFSFQRGGKTVRPLVAERDKGFQLLSALDEGQRKQAVIGDKAIDLLLGPGKDGQEIKTAQGIKGAALTKEQNALLVDLIALYVNIMAGEAAEVRMKEIKAGLADTYFAWSGPTAEGGVAYYRVQGPTLVIEYAPQDGLATHIHTIIRNPTNDYGKNLAQR